MHPHKNLEKLIGTALIDGQFRGNLLLSPQGAASGFDLSDEEVVVLSSANTNSLEELAADVYAWITRAPKPRKMPAFRWMPEAYEGALVAV